MGKKLLTGNKSREELMTDIGKGRHCQHGGQTDCCSVEGGEKPDALVMSRERHTAHESVLKVLSLDGSEGGSVQFAPCRRPIPGDGILGIWAAVKACGPHRRPYGCQTPGKPG
jgi:GTP pyrophosphokinase